MTRLSAHIQAKSSAEDEVPIKSQQYEQSIGLGKAAPQDPPALPRCQLVGRPLSPPPPLQVRRLGPPAHGGSPPGAIPNAGVIITNNKTP